MLKMQLVTVKQVLKCAVLAGNRVEESAGFLEHSESKLF